MGVRSKKEKGKLNTAISAYDFQAELLSLQFIELPLLGVHSNPLGSLPKLHNDPFDRILIAQAMVEGLVLMTADKVVARYPRAIYKV